jgi:transposase
MHKSVSIGLSRRTGNEEYYYLSIDEKSVQKGHEYISILSDEQTGVVIEVVPGRDMKSAFELCESLNKKQRKQVKTICTDMWKPFISGVKTYFPQAKNCHDNFHLVRYLNKAVDKVRRREVKKFEELKHTKYIFLKDKANFTEKQRLKFEAINNTNYAVSKAWQIKENFRDIQFRQDRAEAFSIYNRWRKNALSSQIKEITEVVEIFDRHQIGIINAIETGANNARAERLNGSIQELKTIGRGYRNTQNFRIAILFFHGNLKLFPHEIQ